MSDIFENIVDAFDINVHACTTIFELLSPLSIVNKSMYHLANSKYILEKISHKSNISPGIYKFIKLRKISRNLPYFYFCSVDFLSSSVHRFPPRPVLSFSRFFSFWSIKIEWTDCRNFENIDPIGKISRYIGQMGCLRELRFTGCNISKIPEEIYCLKNLEILDLGRNKISEIPKNINYLSNLKHLFLNNNKIRKIPNSVFVLPKIKSLFLQNNKITSISTMHSLSLNEINYDNNQIKSFPTSVYLPKLRSLHLKHNKIDHIPRFVFALPELSFLYLSKKMVDNGPKRIIEHLREKIQHIMTYS